MERTNVHLTAGQKERLRALAKSTGLKPAELIRRFIDEGLERVERRQKKEDRR